MLLLWFIWVKPIESMAMLNLWDCIVVVVIVYVSTEFMRVKYS